MATGRQGYLVIRADCNAQIGSGHAMRCLALGQAWQDEGGQVAFVMAQTAPALQSRLRSEDLEIRQLRVAPGSLEDARETGQLADKLQARWIVADGYQFGAAYQRRLKDYGGRLLLIDDYAHAEHYSADLVLNQNLQAHPDLYPHKEPDTRLLLGTRYTLLRREFLSWHNWQREIPSAATRILVTMGGSDPDNVTLKVLKALNLLDLAPLEVAVIVGAANPYHEELAAEIRHSRHMVRLLKNVNNMPELMAWADSAVTAGGTTRWELAYMGLPGLLIILAENQQAVAEKLAEKGAAVNLGWHAKVSAANIAQDLTRLLKDPVLRAELSQKGRRLVDGHGAARVLMHLKNSRIRLRPVESDDVFLLWEWANDPLTRQSSLSPNHIVWEKHNIWFQQKLTDPNCHFFIALDENDSPVGQVRFEITDNEAEIHLSIAKGHRGQSLGSGLIDLGTDKIFRLTDINRINAYIKPNNVASLKAFSKANYHHRGNKKIHDHHVLHYIRTK